MSFSKHIIQQIESIVDEKHAERLSTIWDEVAHLIIKRMNELSNPHMPEMHIHLREEMVLELAKLRLSITERIINERMVGRSLKEISIDEEKESCLSGEGLKKIENTARILAEHTWIKRYNDRWKPKTEAALRKEAKPKKTRLVVNRVYDNHFIPKSFIKRYWSTSEKICRYIKNSEDGLDTKVVPFGSWGHRRDLYSDWLEAYFGLIEGDAVQPIEMLLQVEPLNGPQKKSLIGFVIIQWLRNPFFMESLEERMKPIVENFVGQELSNDEAYMRRVYETLYENNEFYDRIARPLFQNRWVVVRSKNPCFILPDTCCVFGVVDGDRYVVMPLTPNDCFIVLPIAETEERVIPFYISPSAEIINDITKLLMQSARKEFLGSQAFKAEINSDLEEPNKIMQRVSLAFTQFIANE